MHERHDLWPFTLPSKKGELAKRAAATGCNANYDSAIAAKLRVIANLKHSSVNLISGMRTLAYAPWICDGLSMDSRLIMHLNPTDSNFNSALQSQAQRDIRVAAHVQDLAEFVRDIAHHRLDLVCVDADETDDATLATLFTLVNDSGLLIVLGASNLLQRVERIFCGEVFVAEVQSDDDAIIVTRKGKQHRLKRRKKQSRLFKMY